MRGLTTEVGFVSLNKKGEELCGDRVEIIRHGDTTTLVLADGLGSGVRSNIRSTLTSKILATMLDSGMQVEDVNRLLKQFEQTQKLMKQFKGMGKGRKRKFMPPMMPM